MCKKPFFLLSFILVLNIAGNASAELIAHWSFDEGTGTTAYDSSPNENNGTLQGDPQWAEGIIGSALEFDGEGDYVEVVNNTGLQLRSTDEFTVAAYVNAGNTDQSVILIHGLGCSTWSSWALCLVAPEPDASPQSTGNFVFTTRSSGVSVYEGATAEVVIDEWVHLAATYDGDMLTLYLDGEEQASVEVPLPYDNADNLYMGADPGCDYRSFFTGWIDEVYIYNEILPQGQILSLMQGGGPYPYASRPTPRDGTLYLETWISLSWGVGDLSVSHDVYLGEDFDDVNEATRDSDVFRGNTTDTYILAGFQGYPYPDGLVPGTTYYWRIDEVNDAEPNSPWKGDIWSFTIPPRTAYDNAPVNGAKFVDPDVILRWTPGFGARLHTVYFGENFDDVNDATVGTLQGATNFDPTGPLEPEKTYYWRVDESDTVDTHKGDVWSFTIAKEGGGIRGDYYRGMDLRNLALTRIDPQVNFNWADGIAPDESVGDDNFSVRWTGEVEAAFTETYTFYTNTDDGARLWVNGRQLIDDWNDHGATENRGTIDLVSGNAYSIVMEYYDNSGGAVAQLRWESPSTSKQIIPQAALSPPIKAGSPNPPNGAVDVKQILTLKWGAGDYAASHQVYFGTDEEVVRNATTGSPEYKGIRNLGSESYDPGQLEWDITYYWRVDEVNNVHPESPWTGGIWSFTTANFLIVDDFEDYNDYAPDRIFDVWIDGFGTAINGSTVGYAEPDFTAGEHFVETTIVHSGAQSMPYFYDNSSTRNSEATLTLVYPRNWTERDVSTLTMWFIGDQENTAESMYVVLNGAAVVYYDNPDAALITEWTEWNIDLQKFADQGVNLTDVNTIGIGFGNRNNPQFGGSGLVFFDDIRLCLPLQESEL